MTGREKATSFNQSPNPVIPHPPPRYTATMSDPAPNDQAADLRHALLTILGQTDALSPKPMTARELAERLGTPESESAIERCCRALHAEGLIDAFHEPYIASRYLITRAGRDVVEMDPGSGPG